MSGDLVNPGDGGIANTDNVLLTVHDVIQKCKQDGCRLFAVGGNLSRPPKFKYFSSEAYPEYGQLYQLSTAVASGDLALANDPGFTHMKWNCLVPESVFRTLTDELKDENSAIRRLSTLPITRCFVYLDVSDFSKHSPGKQALVIGSLIALIRDWRNWHHGLLLQAWQDLEAMLCIGDGYIFVLKNVALATYFAAWLAHLVEEKVADRKVPVEFHFRMGVHLGPVYFFWDWGRGGRDSFPKNTTEKAGDGWRRTEVGDWNYIGEGINGGQRVLTAIGKDVDDVLFISGQVRQELMAFRHEHQIVRGMLGCLVNRGRRLDKHNNHWRVYEMNHTELCGIGAWPQDALPLR
jgi:hypothetical protein